MALESVPPGVQVFADGNLLGLTPVVAKLSAGSHILAWNYQDRNYTPQFVDVAAGVRTSFSIRLNLADDDSPRRGDQVRVDSALLTVRHQAMECMSKAYGLGAGVYQARVRVGVAPGAAPQVELVNGASAPPALAPCLAKLAERLGGMTVQAPTEGILQLELTRD